MKRAFKVFCGLFIISFTFAAVEALFKNVIEINPHPFSDAILIFVMCILLAKIK